MENKDTRTFEINPKIEMKKVQFKNRYGIVLAGDLYLPEGYAEKKNPAVIVSGPFGAVKEQASGLYAQELAARGFVSMAFDPSFGGESGGEVRNRHPRRFSRKITVRRWIMWGFCLMWTGNGLAQSASAVCPAWQSQQQARIPGLRQ